MVFTGQLHPWKVSPKKAFKVQKELRKKIILKGRPFPVKKIAGVDVGFSGNKLIAAVCIFNFPGLELIESKKAAAKVTFPYVPGLLTFREGPVVLNVFRMIKNNPDVILFDGQGICHPRRMGIAAHLGIVLDTPSIGCAKSHLCGVYKMPKRKRGSFSYIYDNKTGEKLGAVLRTRTDVKPIFVSIGHKIDLEKCIELVLKVCPKYRIPEPLRHAHRFASFVKNN